MKNRFIQLSLDARKFKHRAPAGPKEWPWSLSLSQPLSDCFREFPDYRKTHKVFHDRQQKWNPKTNEKNKRMMIARFRSILSMRVGSCSALRHDLFSTSSRSASNSKEDNSVGQSLCTHLKVSSPRSGVLLVMLSRPSKLNALSAALMAELKEVLASATMDPDVGCVVLTGEGKAFCAGSDIKGFHSEGILKLLF